MNNNRASHQFFDSLLKHILLLRQHSQPTSATELSSIPLSLYSNVGPLDYPSSIISNITSLPQTTQPMVTKIIISHNSECTNAMEVTSFPQMNSDAISYQSNNVLPPKRQNCDISSLNDSRANQQFSNSFIQYNSSFKLDETQEPQRKKSKPTPPADHLIENYNFGNTFVNHTMETYKTEQEKKGNLPKRSRGRPRKNTATTNK